MQAVVRFDDGTVGRYDEPLAVILPKLMQAGKRPVYSYLSPEIKTYTELQIKRMEAAEKKRRGRPRKDNK